MCKPGLVKENKSKRNHVYERVIDRVRVCACVCVFVCVCMRACVLMCVCVLVRACDSGYGGSGGWFFVVSDNT